MSPAMTLPSNLITEDDRFKTPYHKGVKHLCDSGITKVPHKYILPTSERHSLQKKQNTAADLSIKLPVIDFSQLHGPNRSQVLESLDKACQEFGFFQVINHGIEGNVIGSMIEAGRQFFELPFEERAKHMSNDMFAPVRYGTSFNQNKDGVFCWRDFLKLMCQPGVYQHWPSSPKDFRTDVVTYSTQTKHLFSMVMEAVLESLGIVGTPEDDGIMNEFNNGSQLMVVNCYPACPEPDLTRSHLIVTSENSLISRILKKPQRRSSERERGRELGKEEAFVFWKDPRLMALTGCYFSRMTPR